MAYYIFLKSLRSPEEFTKNPHVKIPPKSPPTNFQSLVYSEIQFLFGNNSPQISARPAQPLPRWPATPAGHRARARPIRPKQPWRICQKAPLLQVCAVRQQRFLSLTHHCHVGPAHQFHSSPRADRPQSRSHLASPHPITPRRPGSCIEMPIKAPYSPALIPPLESPLTPSPAINGLGCKSPAVTHRQLHPEQPPTPIKGEHHPGLHRTSPCLSSLLSMLEHLSHRAPPLPIRHRSRPASTSLLHLR
jgi:hypothetical protein